jgi:hypothetical protein
MKDLRNDTVSMAGSCVVACEFSLSPWILPFWVLDTHARESVKRHENDKPVQRQTLCLADV